MVDVSGLPVLDVHAHPFLNKGAVSAEQFTDLTSFGTGFGGTSVAPRRTWNRVASRHPRVDR